MQDGLTSLQAMAAAGPWPAVRATHTVPVSFGRTNRLFRVRWVIHPVCVTRLRA